MRVLLVLFFVLPITVWAQDTIEGNVYDHSTEAKEPVLGANVYWLDTDVGAATDIDGNFTIDYKETYQKLIISYVGYTTDTLNVTAGQLIRHGLRPTGDLDEVKVSARRKASARSFITAQNTILVSSDELLKAACCNLSESFETNPSIDVNFADAVTGTRQIRMLGLKSPNILITSENIPSIRGAAQAYGLSFIPGTWVESIQITKGAGSVVNGFESIAGQINAELQKPTRDFSFYHNMYVALNGRKEMNTHFNTKVSDRWDTGLYLHGNLRNRKFDKNGDSFLDLPLAKQINVMNRWQYTNPEKGIFSFINFRFMDDEKQAGQVKFNPELDPDSNFWGSIIETQRFDVSAKVGWVNPQIPYQSVGVQTAMSYHDQESFFGFNDYDIEHTSFYGNVIYNSIIGDSRHKVKTGLSATYDAYDELVNEDTYQRKENSVGAFFEYAYDNLDALSLTAGLRADNHNLLGFFVTPRLHVKYTPWERSAFRASIGSGRRSANVFTENQQFFSSSRAISIVDGGGSVYGLNPEKAWNYGVSYLQGFTLFGTKGDITFDYYRTDFEDQVVVDWENPQFLKFYNLQGESYANSFQAELNYNLTHGLDLRMAYKYYDIQTTYTSGKKEKPLTPKNRVFANIGYETDATEKGGQWKFDLTYNWLDSQRFPSTNTFPLDQRLGERSPTVSTLNAQVTKVISPRFEVYLGGENITNVRQDNPILNSEDPFGLNFDANYVYGPIFGSMYYAGLRYKIE